MTPLSNVVKKIRSKNAGPFWLTIDIFCGDADAFETVRAALTSERVADALLVQLDDLKRFDIADLNVVKFSVPRRHYQGTISDRDMHGASYANILAEMEI